VDWGETGFAAGMSWWTVEHARLYLWLAALAGALCFGYFLGRSDVPARVCAGWSGVALKAILTAVVLVYAVATAFLLWRMGQGAIPPDGPTVTLTEGSTYWHSVDWALVVVPLITDLLVSVPAALVVAARLHGRTRTQE
jgi:hypothetical protein